MILFLDFDGVLHPVFPRADLPDAENQLLSYLPRLEAVLRDFPAVRIVVASDWRRRHSLQELQGFFAEDLRGRLVSTTPILPRTEETWTGHRQQEALTWLTENNLVGASWAALDDDPENWHPGAQLVLCDDGFRDAEEQLLRTLLAKLGIPNRQKLANFYLDE